MKTVPFPSDKIVVRRVVNSANKRPLFSFWATRRLPKFSRVTLANNEHLVVLRDDGPGAPGTVPDPNRLHFRDRASGDLSILETIVAIYVLYKCDDAKSLQGLAIAKAGGTSGGRVDPREIPIPYAADELKDLDVICIPPGLGPIELKPAAYYGAAKRPGPKPRHRVGSVPERGARTGDRIAVPAAVVGRKAPGRTPAKQTLAPPIGTAAGSAATTPDSILQPNNASRPAISLPTPEEFFANWRPPESAPSSPAPAVAPGAQAAKPIKLKGSPTLSRALNLPDARKVEVFDRLVRMLAAFSPALTTAWSQGRRTAGLLVAEFDGTLNTEACTITAHKGGRLVSGFAVEATRLRIGFSADAKAPAAEWRIAFSLAEKTPTRPVKASGI